MMNPGQSGTGPEADRKLRTTAAAADELNLKQGLVEGSDGRSANWAGLRLTGFFTFVAMLGPGWIVMMADTDVGSVITAAQNGARWGYALLPLQFLLIPVLFVVQELTARLGIFTGKGHGELIRERFGAEWGWVSIGGLSAAIVGAIISEFSGVAGVSDLLGVPRAVSLSLAAGFLLLVRLNLGIEVMNALLLPLVLAFLVLLAARALPEEHRLRGARLRAMAATCAITSGVGIW